METGSEVFWTDEAFSDRFAMEVGVIGVATGSYGPVKGEVLLSQAENLNYDALKYDHIVEGGLDISSGVIQVKDCPISDIHAEIKVQPGVYRFRIYSLHLDTVVDDEGDDYYKIEVWQGNILDKRVIKRYGK
ncbi:MAG: hypothetical protein R2794_06775 [Chitinophagales bacterium]